MRVEPQDRDNDTAETNLLLNVVQRVWRVNGKTDENDVRIWVAEWTKAVVVFLAGGIPQGELDVFSIDLYICDVVLEDGWDVNLVDHGIVRLGKLGKIVDTNLWESSFREDYQQASLGDERMRRSRRDGWECIPFRKHRRRR